MGDLANKVGNALGFGTNLDAASQANANALAQQQNLLAQQQKQIDAEKTASDAQANAQLLKTLRAMTGGGLLDNSKNDVVG